jgi:hypothetical protein
VHAERQRHIEVELPPLVDLPGRRRGSLAGSLARKRYQAEEWSFLAAPRLCMDDIFGQGEVDGSRDCCPKPFPRVHLSMADGRQ